MHTPDLLTLCEDVASQKPNARNALLSHVAERDATVARLIHAALSPPSPRPQSVYAGLIEPWFSYTDDDPKPWDVLTSLAFEVQDDYPDSVFDALNALLDALWLPQLRTVPEEALEQLLTPYDLPALRLCRTLDTEALGGLTHEQLLHTSLAHLTHLRLNNLDLDSPAAIGALASSALLRGVDTLVLSDTPRALDLLAALPATAHPRALGLPGATIDEDALANLPLHARLERLVV